MANLVIKQLTTLGNLVSLVGSWFAWEFLKKTCRNTVANCISRMSYSNCCKTCSSSSLGKETHWKMMRMCYSYGPRPMDDISPLDQSFCWVIPWGLFQHLGLLSARGAPMCYGKSEPIREMKWLILWLIYGDLLVCYGWNDWFMAIYGWFFPFHPNFPAHEWCIWAVGARQAISTIPAFGCLPWGTTLTSRNMPLAAFWASEMRPFRIIGASRLGQSWPTTLRGRSLQRKWMPATIPSMICSWRCLTNVLIWFISFFFKSLNNLKPLRWWFSVDRY